MKGFQFRQAMRLALVAASIAITGCVSNDIVKFDNTVRPSKSVSSIEVLTAKPTRPHKVIARLQVGPDAFVGNYQGQTEELVKLVAELGADAVIVSYSTRNTPITSTGADNLNSVSNYASKFTVGEAIVYTN